MSPIYLEYCCTVVPFQATLQRLLHSRSPHTGGKQLFSLGDNSEFAICLMRMCWTVGGSCGELGKDPHRSRQKVRTPLVPWPEVRTRKAFSLSSASADLPALEEKCQLCKTSALLGADCSFLPCFSSALARPITTLYNLPSPVSITTFCLRAVSLFPLTSPYNLPFSSLSFSSEFDLDYIWPEAKKKANVLASTPRGLHPSLQISFCFYMFDSLYTWKHCQPSFCLPSVIGLLLTCPCGPQGKEYE